MSKTTDSTGGVNGGAMSQFAAAGFRAFQEETGIGETSPKDTETTTEQAVAEAFKEMEVTAAWESRYPAPTY